jgi:hypothetical protein
VEEAKAREGSAAVRIQLDLHVKFVVKFFV